jgi:hypothetical protein
MKKAELSEKIQQSDPIELKKRTTGTYIALGNV